LRWEVSLGDNLVEPFVRQLGGECRTQAGQDALDALGQRLGEAGGQAIPFHFRVARASTINAFALPGGQIVVADGLIKDAASPDELAAVLAHEMSHVILRHVTEQTIRSVGLGWTVLMMTGEPSGVAATTIGTLLRLTYSRKNEAEADAMGVELLRKADISTRAMSNFFLRLAFKEQARGTPPAFLSDHPRTATRGADSADQAFTRPALPDQEWQSLRTICD
jgi:predicted Zn-dependent protease